MRFLRFGLYKSPAGLISEKALWVFCDQGYMYENESFWRLLIILFTEWKDGKHIVG